MHDSGSCRSGCSLHPVSPPPSARLGEPLGSESALDSPSSAKWDLLITVFTEGRVRHGGRGWGCSPVRPPAACSVASGRRAAGTGCTPRRRVPSHGLCLVPGRVCWGGEGPQALPLDPRDQVLCSLWVTQPHVSLWPPSPAGRWQGSWFGLTGLGFQLGRATSLRLVGSHCRLLPSFQQRDSAASQMGRAGRGGVAHVPEIRADCSSPVAGALVSQPPRSGTPPSTDGHVVGTWLAGAGAAWAGVGGKARVDRQEVAGMAAGGVV